MSPVVSTQELTERLDPLLNRAGYVPLASLTVSGDAKRSFQELAHVLPTFWVGAPYGSLSFVGACQADRLDETTVTQLMDRIFRIALDLLLWTGQLVFHGGLGPAVRLGVFGRVLFVWESSPQVAVQKVQRIKRIHWFKKCQVVPWIVVLPHRRVYGHHGLPFTMGPPTVHEIQQLLSA